jgi:hypothetical protein
MAMLPLADWQKKHAREVYTESIKIINGWRSKKSN